MRDKKRYDLNLGSWGPYNKEYLGICHIADENRGATFNVELFPGFFRRSVPVSKAVSDGGLKMWGAEAQLSHFVYRYELEWKDRVYVDADFAVHNDKVVDITCNFVNNTDQPQSVNMNLCAYLQYPMRKNGPESLGMQHVSGVVLQEGTKWIDAIDYKRIECDRSIASDGKYLCEASCDGATGRGTALSGGFTACYDASGVRSFGLRYIAAKDSQAEIILSAERYQIALPKSEGFSYAWMCADKNSAKEIIIKCEEGIILDGIAVGKDAPNVKFSEDERSLTPYRMDGDNCFYISYPEIDRVYKISWEEPVQMVRRFYCDDIGDALIRCMHNHVSTVIKSGKPGENVYENVLSEPLYLAPRQQRQLHFTVSCAQNAAEEKRGDVKELFSFEPCSDGQKYKFSQNMMAYNTLLNVVYPVYTRRQFIRHNTPGRNWDSLYTWDSGFIGMGLSEIDFLRAYDCLNTYLTPVGDIHSPFIFHGSVVPTQVFLYQRLIEKYGDDEEKLKKLKTLYPMMKQYVKFFIDMDKDKNQLGSGLLKTWHIFYNSGGWDDYPPQKAMHENAGKENCPNSGNTTPVITTAVTVLIAKIMTGIARRLNIRDSFEEDTKKYVSAIMENLWDEECGYFSYMVHDENGRVKEFMRYNDGTNFNMGFDGIYPYIAGITNEHQSARIIDNIKHGLMTDIGVGVVDKRAPYYTPFGYWNGSVWMPHQWILWKSLLDHGESELAFDIAKTALDIWAREVDNSYCCFEHFMSANGRGSGFHQFSGLSTPVLMFFSAYYIPGSINTGFMTSIKNVIWGDRKERVSFDVSCMEGDSSIIVVLSEKDSYRFTVDGKEICAKRITSGAWQIKIGAGKHHISAD